MAVTGSVVAVDTTVGGTQIVTTATGGRAIVTNAGSAAVFLGASGVTTATGYSLANGVTIEIPLKGKDVLYGIVAAASEDVHVLLID